MARAELLKRFNISNVELVEDLPRRVREGGNVVPIIGSAVVNNGIFDVDEQGRIRLGPGREEFDEGHQLVVEEGLARDWAESIEYPLVKESPLLLCRVAQYNQIKIEKADTAKACYLGFLKLYLLLLAQSDPDAAGTAASCLEEIPEGATILEIVNRLSDDSFSDLACRLGYPKYQDKEHDPLYLLARLPFPTYVTTSHHDFLERALIDAGKRPRVQVCSCFGDAYPDRPEKEWFRLPSVSTEKSVPANQDDSGDKTSAPVDRSMLRRYLSESFDEEELRSLVFDLDIDYDSLRGEGKAGKARELLSHCERHNRLSDLVDACARQRPDIPWIPVEDLNTKATADMPIVYHLYGLEKYPGTLVISEDDYMDFLVKVSSNGGSFVPLELRKSLGESSMILLGYRLRSWEFRALFRGIIKLIDQKIPNTSNLAIQLNPPAEWKADSTEMEEYLREAKGYLQKHFQPNFTVEWDSAVGFARKLLAKWREGTQ